MNSPILNSILNGDLKPWLISFDDERDLKEIIRQVLNKPNENSKQIQSNLTALLKPFPALLKGLNYPTIEPLVSLAFGSNLPIPVTLFNHYYKAIIDAEIIRYFNITIHNPRIVNNELDVPYQIGHQALKGIADLCNQANNEINERQFSDSDFISDITQFALEYLKDNLFALYFSIQDLYKEHLTTVYDNLDDFILYCFTNECKPIQLMQLQLIKPKTKTIPKQPAIKETPKLSFGYKGKDANKLENLFDDLCVDINFLDEEKTSIETLVELLTSKDITIGSPSIYLGCRTTEFVIVMDEISKHFQRLTQTTIERSKCFWSKPANNKPFILISSSTISKSRTKNKAKEEVISEIKATIDKYLK